MAAHRDTRLFFLKTFDVPGEHDAAPTLVRKMIGVRGANIRAITNKIRGTRINLSAHDYTDASGEVVPALFKVCATIRAKDEPTARRVVAELSALKDKCENPARLTWTPTNKAPGAFIGKGARIIRSFNKRHNVRCWFDNEERHFVIESIERQNVLAAVADLEKRDVSPRSRSSSPKAASVATRSTNSFAALAEEEERSPHTINLDAIDAMEGVAPEIKAAMKKALEGEAFPKVGTAAAGGAGAGRGKWSARREDTMAAITAAPVPPPASKKPVRPAGLTIKRPARVPVMQTLDSPLSGDEEPLTRQVAVGGGYMEESRAWWDDGDESDGFSPLLKRQTSFKGGAAGAEEGGSARDWSIREPWTITIPSKRANGEPWPITIPSQRADETRGEAALPCVDGE